MKRFRSIVASVPFVLALSFHPSDSSASDMLPFQDPGLGIEIRVRDLLGRLTLDEKISLLHQFQPAIPRLGIPDFKAGTEGLHGVAWSTDRDNGGAVVTATGTVFPQAIGLATTWNTDLIRQVGEAVGAEVRGYHALAPRVWGLQVWAPVVNLLRDPRWGRNEEGYSEDPLLSGAIATAYGRGLEGDDPLYLKTAPVIKHYLANNNEIHRDTTSSNLRPRVKHEYDELAFKIPIAADAVTGVMTSYNLVNGRPCTVNPDVGEVVRSWTEKTLYNVSDAWAPNNLSASQKYFATSEEAFAATLLAGVDSFTVDDANSARTIEILRSALAQGLLTEEDIDASVEHVLSVRLRLGDFDPDGGPYAGIGPEVIDSPEHRQLARRAADEAMVLLANRRRLLPLDPSATRRIAVVGPLSDTLYTDWYSGALPYRVTPLDGIRERLSGATVLSSEGVDRIVLRDVASGRYVTAGADEDGDILRVGAASAGPTEEFDVFDWGQGIVTLRSAANGKVVDRFNFGPNFANRAAQPYGWFVQQQFVLEPQSDGTHVIRYAGYEKAFDWAGPEVYLTIAEDGALALTATEAANAAHFAVDVVRSGVDEAVRAATGADAAVVVVGSMPFINGREDHDRTSMALADRQSALVRAVLAANPRTILVMETSYPMTIPWEKLHVPAILWTTHAGQETGHAISDVLFGDHNPAGRLTQTWYRSADDLPDVLDYDIIKARRTYLYFDGDPLYPFGYGLSYSTFGYDNLQLSARSVQAGDPISVRVDVTNTSLRAGDEVVQLYSRQPSSRDPQPAKQLRAFRRIRLAPGEKRTVELAFAASDLAHWDVTRSRWVLEAAGVELMVGSSSADIRRSAVVRVRGERIPARDLARETRALDFDDYAGIELVDESKEWGDAVGATAGDWLRFSDVELGSGASHFSGGFARAEAGDALVEIRLDDPVRGKVVGTAVVPSTGDVYAYATAAAELDGAYGRHDVYLVFRGAARLSTFAID
ncbi:glycoside hydrolase family 3 C-terminal domain-containing protein [Sorangium sp. So ce295]|uniref:glycoside hydrolase family 3 C-terminal domain-containing protein n=1 Tax=Sorangium sp. So ce295 TaxID=3133295 RepID=UPI003F631EE6